MADSTDDDLERQVRQPCDSYTMHSGRRECRICLQGEENDQDKTFVQPCQCSGSISWVHRDCLCQWVQESRSRTCEICKTPFDPDLVKDIPIPETISMYDLFRQGSGVRDEARETGARQTWREWMPVIVTVAVVAVLVLIVALIGMNASEHEWASILLRVLAFSLPTLLILRVVWVYIRARRAFNS